MFKPIPHQALKLALLLSFFAITEMYGDETPRPALPVLQIKHGIGGEEAIAALADKLPAVAAHYLMNAEELRSRLRSDHDLHLDAHGNLFYTCSGLAVTHSSPTKSEGSTSTQQLFPLSQTFLLHSKPSANRVIYLDFDGHTLSGDAWTDNYNGGNDIVAPPWDTDGNPSSFSTAEQTAIQQIWFRVAEDYAPYDVDVTTEYPGEAAITRSRTSDSAYGTRALISPISSYFGNIGGIAYVGAYNDTGNAFTPADYYKPALIFPENLGPNNEKYIAEAISHEVGHNLGLSHDGTTTGSEYYTGQGNWAPIMGAGYYHPISQWSRGEYTNANNTENDLAVITQYGLSYRTDDYGSTPATATALSGTNAVITGIIERTNDVDMFSFTTGTGTAQITVTNWERGANLHLSVSLYNSSGVLITNREAADTSSGVQPVAISTYLSSGTYYIGIDGVGSGDPLTTGYSDYGSLGNYTLLLTLAADTSAPGSWLPTAAGTFTWTNSANWSAGIVPNGIGTNAYITNGIIGNQTISLDSAVTLGNLALGSVASANSFTIQNGTGGSLYFDVLSGQSRLTKVGTGTDIIAANLNLADDLIVSNGGSGKLTLSGSIGGARGLIKIGTGRVRIAGTNTFTGNTVISNGTLEIGPSASLASTQLEVKAGAAFEATNSYNVPLAQTLTGDGSISGNLVVTGTISPGLAGIGTLTASSNVTLTATAATQMEIDPISETNDVLLVNGTLFLGGHLTVTNLGTALTNGDAFILFNAGSITGSFSSLTLPPLDSMLVWNTNQLNSAGTLSVIRLATPAMQSTFVNPTNFTVSFFGVEGATYVLQTATNTDALAGWIDLETNNGTTGVNAFQIPIGPEDQRNFYRVRAY